MEEKIINNITTKSDFIACFKKLNIKRDDYIIAHTAMSKFYYIPGGPETVIDALEETIPNGTMIMPSEVTTNCDPATWEYPPVRNDLIQNLRDSMPPYNPDKSITEGLGQVPEYFRKLKNVIRSNHPYLPLAVWGKNKDIIAKNQPLDLPYGLNSPLDYLYQHQGKIIFLGTDYETCTMLHYAESTISRPTKDCFAATDIGSDGKTIWTKYQNIDMDSYDDFNELGAVFEKEHPNTWQSVKLAQGIVKVIEAKPLINFARKWFKAKDQEAGNNLN